MILVTGGAGFIGSHTVDALIDKGYEVRIFDSLEDQVHGGAKPQHLNPHAEFVRGDVRDPDALRGALEGVEAVFHLAAAVGVGQSMYEIHRYMDYNTLGTANLLDLLANHSHGVRKLIVASSMSIYGEGMYECPNCGFAWPKLRSQEQMTRRQWEVLCEQCGAELTPVPTPETKPLLPTSPYAVGKRDQEELCLSVGWAYGIPAVALRYFNVYGPRQALSNPYTGAAAIFATRIIAGQPPIIYEDGLQSRDLTHVSDIVQANLLAMESDGADYCALNVGTGRPTTILTLAEMLCEHLGGRAKPDVTHKARAGDIRHCYADISLIQDTLGFEPKITLEKGMGDLVAWARGQGVTDKFDAADGELSDKGLVR